MSGQYINHFGAVRFRVTGSGNLRGTLTSTDPSKNITLAPLAMSAVINRYPVVLCNFMQPKAQLTLTTTDIDETLVIREIHIYIKPTYVSYPQ